MWSKDEQHEQPSTPTAVHPQPSSEAGEQTRIGASVSLEGTLRCEEDLCLEGKLKGSVSVPNHRVVIGSTGQVKADIHARVIEVEGHVIGDLVGVERVVVSASGNVLGNLKAPRVILENGAQFKGAIDMEPARSSTDTGADAGAPQRKGPKQSAVPTSTQGASDTKASVSVS